MFQNENSENWNPSQTITNRNLGPFHRVATELVKHGCKPTFSILASLKFEKTEPQFMEMPSQFLFENC